MAVLFFDDSPFVLCLFFGGSLTSTIWEDWVEVDDFVGLVRLIHGVFVDVRGAFESCDEEDEERDFLVSVEGGGREGPGAGSRGVMELQSRPRDPRSDWLPRSSSESLCPRMPCTWRESSMEKEEGVEDNEGDGGEEGMR